MTSYYDINPYFQTVFDNLFSNVKGTGTKDIDSSLFVEFNCVFGNLLGLEDFYDILYACYEMEFFKLPKELSEKDLTLMVFNRIIKCGQVGNRIDIDVYIEVRRMIKDMLILNSKRKALRLIDLNNVNGI
jgi:hypothetical protein